MFSRGFQYPAWSAPSIAEPHSTAILAAPAEGLLWRGQVRPRCGTARMRASPSADLSRLDDAIVVGIHRVELCSCAPRRAVLGALDELLPGEAARSCRRWARRGSA